MKAEINGIKLEGTPEEIIQYIKLGGEVRTITPAPVLRGMEFVYETINK